MRLAVRVCKALNARFPLPAHPFNEGAGSLPEWQYERGADTLKYYLPFASPKEMFADKTVLDVGCAAAGKTLYYASLGVNRIVGLDILETYRAGAGELAGRLNLRERFEFVCGDAGALPFAEGAFDTVIMNDAFEHVPEPEAALREALRVLKPRGRLFVNFPPYKHPLGAHLSDAIGLPWAHVLFSEDTVIEVYRDAVMKLPDGRERLDFRVSKDGGGRDRLSGINKMTLRRAKNIVKTLGLKPVYHAEHPLRPFLSPLAKLPGVKELFVKMAVYVFEKD